MPFPVAIYPKEGELPKRPYGKILFLSPVLENEELDISIAVIGHELAHLLFGHSLIAKPEVYETQENAASDKIKECGFTQEERKHRKL